MTDNLFVTADAQFGNGVIMRPAADFAVAYQGKSIIYPILFGPEGQILDPESGNVGYSTRLAKGLSVPFGARISILIPYIAPGITVAPPGVSATYHWSIAWRIRNLFDYRQNRTPFHLPKQTLGVASTLVGDAGTRVVLVSAWQTIPYVGALPAAGTVAEESLRTSRFVPDGSVGFTNLPILNAAGDSIAIGQGVLDPGAPLIGYNSQTARGPIFQIYETQAQGDELLLLISRENGSKNTWDFTMDDQTMSGMFAASNEIGIYVFAGTAP